jgi:hypothetical protein
MKKISEKVLMNELNKITDDVIVKEIKDLLELYKEHKLSDDSGTKAQAILDSLFIPVSSTQSYVIPKGWFDSELAYFLFSIKYSYEKYYNVLNVANALNMSRQMVSRDIKDGKLSATTLSGSRSSKAKGISHAELIRYAEIKGRKIEWSELV